MEETPAPVQRRGSGRPRTAGPGRAQAAQGAPADRGTDNVAAGAVFADDITVEELAAREKQPAAKRKQSSSDQYDKSAKKWWTVFLKAAKWDEAVKGNFVNEAGEPCDGTFRRLFIWLYEQDVTKGVFNPMLAWAQARLNTQLQARMLPERPDYVCKVVGVKSRKDEIYGGARQSHMECMMDLQAAIESDIGFDKMIQMVEVCLNCDVPGTSELFCMQILFELRATHQEGARHDDLRDEVFAHIFARFAKKLGPRGMWMRLNVTDGGKTNNNGRISYSAVLPHHNPLLCTIFAKAMLFPWRFLILKVPFPDLLTPWTSSSGRRSVRATTSGRASLTSRRTRS